MAKIAHYIKAIGSNEEKEVYLETNPKGKLVEPFCRAMSKGMQIISLLDLTARELKILLFIISGIDFENYCYYTQSYIAKILKISQPNVSKSVKRLCDYGLVFKEKTPRGNAIRVSAVIVWKNGINKEYKDRWKADSELLVLSDDIFEQLQLISQQTI